MQKLASLNLFNDEDAREAQLNLHIDNILFFREALVKRMNNLKVRVEARRIMKGQQPEKRLLDKDINRMSIDQVINNLNSLKVKIEANDVSYYSVNTFMTLCGKAVEYYSAINDENHMLYLNTMKTVLSREDVQKILYGDK